MLMLFTETTGQKPTIDLLPFKQKRVHPEAIIDTSFSKDSAMKFVSGDQSSPLMINEKEKKKISKRESWKSWFNLDSLFQKKVSKSNLTGKQPVKYSLIPKYINPIKFFIHVTALKF